MSAEALPSMSLKDLLPPGTYDEITSEAHVKPAANSATSTSAGAGTSAGADTSAGSGTDAPLMVTCPTCHKKIVYSSSNPFRPFCSERCKLIDLGAWASEERTVPGRMINEDEDADLLNDPNLPVRHSTQD